MNFTPTPSLLSIIAHARSGSLDHAWRLFRLGGYERARNDVAALNVRGRLLKDSALRVDGTERRRFYREAAKSYARAAKLGGEAYPLINAATLSLLAGRGEQSRKLARQVLDHADDNDTAYYRAATKAEAQLLLGDIAGARASLEAAIAKTPKAYEDHASTLRQFGLILDALGEDKSWLDSCRPPRALHFAGLMAVEGGDIARRIREAIKQERIGFGYGALAAGADILIAEALLEARAELDLVLPARKDLFREASVARFGRGWAKKFDRILKSAHSVRAMETGSNPLSPLAIHLAAEVAMGRAVMQANRLETEAVQLLVLDRKTQGKDARGSQWIASTWKKSGRRQHVLIAPRAQPAGRAPVNPPQSVLAAMLRLDLSDAADRLPDGVLTRLARTLTAGMRPLMAPRWTGDAVLVAYDSAAQAARAALAAMDALAEPQDMRVAGHYAVVRRVPDPFGSKPFLAGPETVVLGQIALSTPSGAIHLSENFAAALHAESAGGVPRTEHVGELPGKPPVALFSLRR